MVSWLFRTGVVFISILLANLLTGMLYQRMVDYNGRAFQPLIATAIGMAALVIIFYPLFKWVGRFSDWLSRHYMKTGKKMMGKVGMAAAFLLAFAILFFLYAKLWFGINVLDIALRRVGW